MKFTFLCLVPCLFLACAARSKPQTATFDSVRCFKVTQVSPLRNYFGPVVHYDSFYAYIYTYRNQLLYRTSYIYTTTKVEDSVVVDDSILIRYKDLVLTQDQPYGGLYDMESGIYNKKVRADSMLKQLSVIGTGIFNGPMEADTLLMQRNWHPHGDTTLFEEYSAKLKRDTTFKIFSNLKLWYIRPIKGCPFSFNSRLDSIRGQQVCRVSINNRIEFVIEGKPRVSAFTQNYTLQEIPVTNAAELLPIFERQKRGEYSVQVTDALKE